MEQEYLVLVRIGGPGDKEMWLPGSRIMLSGDRAMAHLAAGNVRAINDTIPPAPATDDMVVHGPIDTALPGLEIPAKGKVK